MAIDNSPQNLSNIISNGVNRKKAIVSAIAVVAVLVLVWQFRQGPKRAEEVCPPNKCTYSTEPPPASFKAAQMEPGRYRQDFAPKLPPDFPPDIPIDPNPVKVLQSYVESMVETEGENVVSHAQMTYMYVTKQTTEMIIGNIEKYLQKNNYEVGVSEWNTLSGRFVEGPITRSLTVFVSYQNQFERRVSISYIVGVYNSPARTETAP